MSQVKRLGELIDLIHNQQICLLKEHLQYLRAQSSFNNIFYKLETLDQIIKVIFVFYTLKCCWRNI